MVGTDCQFYAIANFETSSVASKTELLTLIDDTPNAYDGTFQELTTSYKRENSFVMTGNTEATIAPSGSPTETNIPIKRTVAKIAIKAAVSDTFSELYGGKLTLVSTKIENAPVACYLIEPTSSTIATTYTATQAINSNANAIYYVYGNEHITQHGKIKLTINAVYDVDGNDSTTSDQRDVTYEILLNGSGAGVIKRNGYYRLNVAIDGPSGEDCSHSFSVSDWESPTTQDENVGV